MPETSELMLFHVQGTRSFLLGTCHSLHQPLRLPERWIQVWRVTQALVVEARTDLVEDEAAATFRYTGGKGLKNDIGEEPFNKILSIYEKLGRPTETLNLQRPQTALRGVLDAMLNKMGLKNEFGMDRTLIQAAVEQRRIIHTLEARNALDAALQSIPTPHCLSFLTEAANGYQEWLEDAKSIYQAVLEDDLEKLSHLIETYAGRFPDLFDAIVFNRTRVWLPTILEHLRSDVPTLIAVGALHFIGDRSLPKLLRQNGLATTYVRSPLD
jgi:uncharacterized protein YbaP (TraB family)